MRVSACECFCELVEHQVETKHGFWENYLSIISTTRCACGAIAKMNMEIPGPTAISCAKEPVSDDLLSNAAKTTIAEQKHTVHPVKSAIPI